jgi:uncharacterized protein
MEIIQAELLLILSLFIIAFLYSSVGHGGASGYLSVMAIFGVSSFMMKPVALILNIAVAGIAFFQYYRAGHFRLKLFLPFAITSIPFSFLGGFLTVEPSLYKKTLGAVLMIPAFRTLINSEVQSSYSPQKIKKVYALIAGAGIGLLSGMIGIGGGIILSPLILLFHWANMKETAAVSALFILVNSVSGLAGLVYSGTMPSLEILSLILTVILGGFIGAYTGSKKLSTKWLSYFLAGVLFFASIKLMFF